MILLIVVAVFGGTKLPPLGERLAEMFRDRPALRFQRRSERAAWTWRDWLRVGIAVALGLLALLSIVIPGPR